MQEAAELVSRGREAFGRRAWRDAFGSLSRADQVAVLGAGELELLATSAYMLGRDGEHVRALERAHQAYLDAGETARAVRCAYWIGHNLMLRGEKVLRPDGSVVGNACHTAPRFAADATQNGRRSSPRQGRQRPCPPARPHRGRAADRLGENRSRVRRAVELGPARDRAVDQPMGTLRVATPPTPRFVLTALSSGSSGAGDRGPDRPSPVGTA